MDSGVRIVRLYADAAGESHFEDTVAITDDGPEIMTRPIDRQDLRIWSLSA